jgi:hypothetical protein
MAISHTYKLLAIMLAALMWGCGRSSSNDRPTHGEQLSADEAIEVIVDADVQFDECSLNEFAHLVSHPDDIDEEQLAYMVKQCDAAAHRLSHLIDNACLAKPADETKAEVNALFTQPWIADYECVLRFVNQTPLPPALRTIADDIAKENELIAQKRAKIEQM